MHVRKAFNFELQIFKKDNNFHVEKKKQVGKSVKQLMTSYMLHRFHALQRNVWVH